MTYIEFVESAKKHLRERLTIILIAMIVIAGGLAFYFYGQLSGWEIGGLFGSGKISGVDGKADAQKLITAVSQLILLPEDETPTVATVNDPEVLKNQPFFAKAKKGDKVLIYASSRKAILYDPVSNKIVEIAPINLGEEAGGLDRLRR